MSFSPKDKLILNSVVKQIATVALPGCFKDIGIPSALLPVRFILQLSKVNTTCEVLKNVFNGQLQQALEAACR